MSSLDKKDLADEREFKCVCSTPNTMSPNTRREKAEMGNLRGKLRLCIEHPYLLVRNINVLGELVDGALGKL